jgi:CDP-2,3-bis-(O-geranylgeranyl)-sn-glycerol synthase
VIEALLLVLVANGTPIIADWLLDKRYAWPVDFNTRAPDGNPWFGESKTYRGMVLAMIVTAVAALLIGYSWQLGALFGLLAMVGDLLSSFIKRRMGMSVHSQAPGLDQVPEALVPLAVMAGPLDLQWYEVIVAVIVFWILELLLSRLLYKLHIRKQPY